MTKSLFYCENQGHVGDRIIRDPRDRVVVSEDHMLADGTQRLHRIQLLNLCRDCSTHREKSLRPRGPLTESLFGAGS